MSLWLILRVWDDLDAELAGAWAIEFAEEDGLPAAQGQTAVGNLDGLRHTHQRGFDMRIGVPLKVFVTGVFGNQLVKRRFDVAGNVGVSIFVYGDARGGVRYVKVAQAARDA